MLEGLNKTFHWYLGWMGSWKPGIRRELLLTNYVDTLPVVFLILPGKILSRTVFCWTQMRWGSSCLKHDATFQQVKFINQGILAKSHYPYCPLAHHFCSTLDIVSLFFFLIVNFYISRFYCNKFYLKWYENEFINYRNLALRTE